MKIITDKEEWDRKLKHFNHDIYFTYEYLSLWADEYGGTPEALYWENNRTEVFWPHIAQDKDVEYNTSPSDFTTPYGYGGYLIKDHGSLRDFYREYLKYLQKRKEFIRLHPVFCDFKLIPHNFIVKYIDDVVVVDVTKHPDILFMELKTDRRRNIRKSKRKGLTPIITEHPTKKQLEKFVELYSNTMDLNEAGDRYYFSLGFIENHFKDLKSILIEVKKKGKVIGSSIFLSHNDILEYHLSGRDYTDKTLCPHDLILWNAIEWAYYTGHKKLILGGGRGANDSLYKFKKGFSKLTYPYFIGKIK